MFGAQQATLLVGLILLQAPAETVFHGRPSVKIQEDGVDRAVEKVSSEKAAGFECVISRIGDTYYWASRENRAMRRLEGPGYITYLAMDGSGYVKIVKADVKATVGLVKLAEAAFDYVEHMPFGLTTITYYGSARSIR